MAHFDPNWKKTWEDKLVSAADAVSLIEPGQTIFAGVWTSTPLTLSAALAARAGELTGITILNALSLFPWNKPETLAHYRVVSLYTSPLDRQSARAGQIEYLPVVRWRQGRLPPGMQSDVAMLPISPPDEKGWCSFGTAVWFGPTYAEQVQTLIGEVHPEFIRTGGDNRVHMSQFARVVEHLPVPAGAIAIPPRSEETELAANVICTLVANEIVYDGATLQFGIGDVSAALPIFLGERKELGVHTELLPGGVVDLVAQGVVTGRQKAIDVGKVVAAAAAQLRPDEVAFIDGNPVFEMRDFTYTDDLRNLLQFENFVAVNNALAVDLTGNVSSETMGPQIFSGAGGQSAFAIAASTAADGSVIVLPSSQLVGGIRHTRIVGGHAPGTVVTVHRGYVDYVVTEQGIARLTGKSIRERMTELISIAHPECRAELRKEAERIYGMTIE